MEITTILLCAGKKRHATSIQTSLSNAMTPINGKPAVGWVLDDLCLKRLTNVVVVLREEDERLHSFLDRAYTQRIQLTLTTVSPEEKTILHSLLAGLKGSVEKGPVRILLGDTLIRDPFEGKEDFLYIGSVQESRRWCLPVLTEEGVIAEFIDKKNLPGGPFKAIAGYYHIRDAALLQRCVEQALANGKRELSDALLLYSANRPIRVREVSEWYDFGHIDTIVDARRRLLRPRHFNSLTVNPVLNTITKVSRNDEKLNDELNWYKGLPAEMKVLTPRILSEERIDGQLHLVQEYYGYPTLAESYVFGELDLDTWSSILRNILNIHSEFRRYPGKLSKEVIRDFYIGKTESRLKALAVQSPVWKERLASSSIRWNNNELQNLPALLPLLKERLEEMAQSAEICIIHGDLCFSNILYDLNNQIIRLIDPRGSFGQPGIYGDTRYDIAKLRHSVAGLYDFIVADMFTIQEQGREFESELFAAIDVQKVARHFDNLVVRAGYDINEIKLLEGALFITMLPLHSDHPWRQLLMFLQGISLLNEVLIHQTETTYANSH